MNLRQAIEDVGGLVTVGDIARRIGATASWASQMRQMDGFPEPVGEAGGSSLWAWEDVERWHGERYGGER